MAQHDYIISNATFPAVRTDINNALSAIQTINSGTSRPTGAVSGQLWLDTTNANPTLKLYDGTSDISLATLDYTAHTVNWLDSTVSITGLSTTATGTVLTLSDSASTSTVNLIIDNQKEIRFRESTANGTNYVGLKAPASLSADLTYTLPSADGTSGQALITNGSGVLSFTTISSGTSWQSVQTTGFTASAGKGYPCNTTSSAFTVTLPASPSVGDYVQIVDYAGTFATNNITLGANSNKINGVVANKLLTTNREAVTITYVDSTQGWVSTSATNYGTVSLDPIPNDIDYLVIAGGGSGGYCGYPSGVGAGMGGGGAGGYRTGTYSTVPAGIAITVTVGDGGANVTGNYVRGNSGSNSSISGSGLTTVTSNGGGGGGAGSSSTGLSGGSGGGSSNNSSSDVAGGSGNTPSTSPSQGNNGGKNTHPYYSGGGGGGAGAVGGFASSGGGAGGAGSSSSITGSSVTYAGGGGGTDIYNVGASGGTGGGGAGGNTGTAGTANTGGGGGGGGAGGNSGAGGKGVVILSVLTSLYSGTSTGSPTITTSGSKTILQFNGSGSYTT